MSACLALMVCQTSLPHSIAITSIHTFISHDLTSSFPLAFASSLIFFHLINVLFLSSHSYHTCLSLKPSPIPHFILFNFYSSFHSLCDVCPFYIVFLISILFVVSFIFFCCKYYVCCFHCCRSTLFFHCRFFRRFSTVNIPICFS
jgi:hypothetical protein